MRLIPHDPPPSDVNKNPRVGLDQEHSNQDEGAYAGIQDRDQCSAEVWRGEGRSGLPLRDHHAVQSGQRDLQADDAQQGGTDVVATRLASNTYTTARTFTRRPEMQLGCVSGEVQLVIGFNERTLDTQELVNPGSRESAEANITFAVDGEVYFTAWVHEVVGVTANGLQFDEPATTFDVSVMSEQALAPVWEACGL